MTIKFAIEKTEGTFILPIFALIYDKQDKSVEIVLAFLNHSLVVSITKNFNQ